MVDHLRALDGTAEETRKELGPGLAELRQQNERRGEQNRRHNENADTARRRLASTRLRQDPRARGHPAVAAAIRWPWLTEDGLGPRGFMVHKSRDLLRRE